ncbi:hypothetical protein [Serratia entomophila]|nr:hypothetical protein [Serratia entomophila]CAI0871765.1 Uncharacterised protein [Serratia entomophila]CAI1513212.1 Uncharacterised protein [Serratia entomophila]CAI1590528.1 Uncharacterised protein [Serratia entomophila]CAI1822357.1 Uncharacterised protein [Serratia entomophila]CAI1883944.1 Uncharacterised protein [Serratia entomophila]
MTNTLDPRFDSTRNICAPRGNQLTCKNMNSIYAMMQEIPTSLLEEAGL